MNRRDFLKGLAAAAVGTTSYHFFGGILRPRPTWEDETKSPLELFADFVRETQPNYLSDEGIWAHYRFDPPLQFPALPSDAL